MIKSESLDAYRRDMQKSYDEGRTNERVIILTQLYRMVALVRDPHELEICRWLIDAIEKRKS